MLDEALVNKTCSHRNWLQILYCHLGHFRQTRQSASRVSLSSQNFHDFEKAASRFNGSLVVCLALQRCYRRQTQLLLVPQACLYRFFCCVSLSTFFTIFCSSIKNALTTRSFTQFEHRDPPYARWTVFFGREIVAYSRGRRAGICNSKAASVELIQVLQVTVLHAGKTWKAVLTPGSLIPQSPHFGGLPFFLMCWYRNFPPGVLTTRTLLERVGYLFQGIGPSVSIVGGLPERYRGRALRDFGLRVISAL